MAASTYHGKKCAAWFSTDGGTTYTAFTILKGWSTTLTSPTSDGTPAHTSNTGRIRVAGIPSGTCTITCDYDSTTYVQVDESDNAGANGIKIQVSRTGVNADGGYAGTVICTSAKATTSKDGTNQLVYSFTFTGTISNTITEGT